MIQNQSSSNRHIALQIQIAVPANFNFSVLGDISSRKIECTVLYFYCSIIKRQISVETHISLITMDGRIIFQCYITGES